MLPTFVIGLREGLEAALIVGIIAAFLRKQGRRDLLRSVFVGVGVAVLLCVGVGVALEALSADLPQRKQEALETVIGILAVGMVTYMVVWMRRHSRDLKGQLEGLAADALGTGHSRAGRAMVLMAFLAVLREGFETVVFLLAAFNESGSGAAAGVGAALGVAVAIGLGYGIYRGGVKINLSKFFRATGLVLVLVAAGLVVTALHTAHEAGWLNTGQSATVDLSALVRPGSVQASLLTGMLGVQSHPVLIEVIGWLVYLIPLGVYVVWPPGRVVPSRTVARVTAVVTAVAAVASGVFLAVAPARPGSGGTVGLTTSSGPLGDSATLSTVVLSPAASGAQPTTESQLTVRRSGAETHGGIATDVYTASTPGRGVAGRPTTLDAAGLAALNGGRVPIGLLTPGVTSVAVTYTDTDVFTVWVDARSRRIVDTAWTETITASAGSYVFAAPVSRATIALASAERIAAANAARAADRRLDRHDAFLATGRVLGAVALAALLAAAGFGVDARRRAAPVRRITASAARPVSLAR